MWSGITKTGHRSVGHLSSLCRLVVFISGLVTTFSFVPQLKCKNGSPYMFQPSDRFHCSVNHVPTSTSIPHVVEPTVLVNQPSIKVSFTTRLSGEYCVELKVNGCIVGGRALRRQYQPGRRGVGRST